MILMRPEQGQPVAGILVYRAADYAFATEPRPATCGASFTINEVELMLDDEQRQRVLFVDGYSPSQSWKRSSLRPPVASLGVLRADAGEPVTPGSATAMDSNDVRWPVLVDPGTGWIRLGAGDPDSDREGLAFAPGAIAVLEGERLVALWLRPAQLSTF
jgi:hypothetical protein